MGKWLSWIRLKKNKKEESASNWPIWISFIVAILNTEIAIAFILGPIFGLTGKALGLAAGMWASTEICWWFWFSGWLYQEKIRKMSTVAEAIDVGQMVAKEFDLREFLKPMPRDKYIVARIKYFARNHGIENFDLDNYAENPIFIAVRGLGYVLSCIFIAILGFLPLFWTIGLMICRVTKWKVAIIILLVSNFCKNYFMAYMYEEIGFWWFIIFFFAFITFMAYVIKSVIKNLKSHK